jgi:hypothetical protein
MQFGDGSYKEIEMEDEYDDPDEACEAARTWVNDNAWFEVQNEQGETVGRDPGWIR